MKGPASALRRVVATACRLPLRTVREALYRCRLRRGRPAGDYRYVARPGEPPPSFRVELRLSSGTVTAAETAAWCARQTLPELGAVGLDASGRVAWEVGDRGEAPWFAAPGALPEVPPSHLESCALLLAAETVDAVVLRERFEPPLDPALVTAAAACSRDLRPFALYSARAYRYDPSTDEVCPCGERRVVKLVEAADWPGEAHSRHTFNRFRRGPYLASAPLGARLEVGLRDAGQARRRQRGGERPSVLVLTSFLARGGAEHTLLETMRVLRDRFDFAVATLAPHRRERGDRRADFEQVTPRLISLGDLVHPAAMPGILDALLDSLGAKIVYNANGTTLFYELGPGLKATRPALRIVDHLYDHRVGYVDRYGPELLPWLDACVAENHRIAELLVDERGWPPERVPVVLPCGRPGDELPPEAERAAVRTRLRRELGIGADDVVFLTAARMHPQKRPLDLVELARRVRDLERVRFLVVGGGELEAAVDEAIAGAAGARVSRLPFRADIPDLIVASDLGCLVSEYEGLPVFLLECLQAGRPFLGTGVGDMGELLRATGAGLVVDQPGDLDGLEAAVRRLVDPGTRSGLEQRARTAGAAFTVEACAERYADVLLGRVPAPQTWPETSG